MRSLAKHGFTLIEVLVVVSIISLLTSVILTQVEVTRSRSLDTAYKAQAEELRKAVEQYALDHGGKYPGQLPATGNANVWYDSGCSPEMTGYPEWWTNPINPLVQGYIQLPASGRDKRCIWYSRAPRASYSSNSPGDPVDTNVQGNYDYVILVESVQGNANLGPGMGCYTNSYCIGGQ